MAETATAASNESNNENSSTCENQQNKPSTSHRSSELYKHRCDQDHAVHIDNSGTVLEKIAGLYAERLLSDITLLVSGRQFPAHRLILCASSDVFQVMLMNPNWSESQESRVVLQEEPVCATVFGDFLKYLYTGKINMNHFIVLPVLTLADKYNVKDLMRLCVEYMSGHVVSAAAHHQLVSWLQYCLIGGHEITANICANFITANFQMISDTQDFLSLDSESMVVFLQKSDLVIHNEMALYNCIVRWLQSQEQKLRQVQALTPTSPQSPTPFDLEGQFAMMVTEVMSQIRFPMMSPRELAELLLSPLVVRFKDFFMDRMVTSMAYHSRQQHEKLEELASTPLGRLQFTPRLYTAELWSATLCTDNYRFFPSYGVQTLMFSTPSSMRESESDRMLEWVVDLSPKGVWFKKFYLIVWQGTLEMPETVLKTVRLSITAKDSDTFRVQIGILVYGVQDGVEHVVKVIRKRFVFSADDRVVNMDNLLPFDELNDVRGRSPYLVGLSSNCLKIQIVITPAVS